jgi:hypothetical protein
MEALPLWIALADGMSLFPEQPGSMATQKKHNRMANEILTDSRIITPSLISGFAIMGRRLHRCWFELITAQRCEAFWELPNAGFSSYW